MVVSSSAERVHAVLGYPGQHRLGVGCAARGRIAGWLHQLTTTPARPDGGLLGWGVREDKAMITTLRHRLIRVLARLIRHAAALTLRLPPGHQLLTRVLA
jgi:Ser/Thr protein kinase RdoA (MazF antagonist)